MNRRSCVAVWLFLLTVGPCLSAQDYTQSPGYAAYRRADALFAARKVPDAIQALEQALKEDGKLVPALTLYARIAMTMNRFELARNSLERALAVDPKAVYAQFLYGLNFYLTNDLAHALPQFLKARQNASHDPKAEARAALYLGMTDEGLGKTQEAMEQYEDAVRLNPAADSFVTGARLLYVQGRLDESASWIEKALQLDPRSRDAHFERARLLLRNEKPAGAAKEGELALGLSGGTVSDSQIHYLLIRAYRPIDPAAADRHAQAVRKLEAHDH